MLRRHDGALAERRHVDEARGLALLNQYVRKGSPLFVEGRLEYSTWESQDGGKRNKLEVIVENFQFMSSGNREGGGGGGGGERRGGGRQQAQEAGGEVDYGDIPF